MRDRWERLGPVLCSWALPFDSANMRSFSFTLFRNFLLHTVKVTLLKGNTLVGNIYFMMPPQARKFALINRKHNRARSCYKHKPIGRIAWCNFLLGTTVSQFNFRSGCSTSWWGLVFYRTMRPHASLAPAFPVLELSSSPPRPRSSSYNRTN